jgi:hypothetical protein
MTTCPICVSDYECGIHNTPKTKELGIKEIRNQLLELYGMACSFKMLKTNGPDLAEEIIAAAATGKMIEDKLKEILFKL